ncbi:acetyl-CoA carboxylase biotin carboxyl carrier protein [Jiangella aurantiaca]|uniref:Biotin carboxyl carrier protein of acetyl-CoA carboxylase n=1 Tax=Jiangella aurantiaca TaxID=2530373 RepID=A0A4R5AM75_9ACTN|nr:acetyl-CoA carboxylase biotin carboxyl carrier protein [Jiangella aurantiaca]TDD72706.1 acetyl-CoA carboxylase biotin carboxyl carrier protein [Jiangella aurantiaca]
MNGTELLDDARRSLVSHLRTEATALIGASAGAIRVVELTAGDCSLRVELPAPVAAAPAVLTGTGAAAVAAPAPEDGPEHHGVRAPLVGTFYRRPAPEADAFVEVGDVVAAGQTLGIVEAMKLMNEIKSDRAGRVVAIRPADGQMVEFDEVLVELAVDGH